MLHEIAVTMATLFIVYTSGYFECELPFVSIGSEFSEGKGDLIIYKCGIIGSKNELAEKWNMG